MAGEMKEDDTRAREYNRTVEWLVLIATIWAALFNFLVLSSGLSSVLRNRAVQYSPAWLSPIFLYSALLGVISFLTGLPLAWYRGFVVEHRFGLSNQSLRAYSVDLLKGLGVSLALMPALSAGAFWAVRRFPRRWWAVLCGLTIPVTVLFANLAPVLLAPLFNQYQPLRRPDLAERVRNLAAGQGIHVSDVLEMDMSRQTKKANAAFMGLGNTKRIVLADTMLDEFTPEEIEIVVAHELGHQVHRDIWKLIILQAPLSLLSLFAISRLLPPFLRRYGAGKTHIETVEDIAALPAYLLLGEVMLGILTPLVNAVIRREVEEPADRYALDLTRNPGAFVSTMQKLGKMNLANPAPHPIVKWLLYDHPPMNERIATGRRWAASHPQDD
ncbi:MAG: M48 family metallopeptidase [Chloroflexota bacterium]